MRTDLCSVGTGIVLGSNYKIDEVGESAGKFSDSAGVISSKDELVETGTIESVLTCELASDDVLVCAGSVDAAGIK